MAGSNAVRMICMVTTLFWAGEADVSLRSGPKVITELAGAFGGGLAESSKLAQVEDVLRPTFNTLPKNEHGNLGPAVVRYALHRFFVKKHAWYVKSLELGEAGQNASSPTAILKGRVPLHVEALFEEQLSGRGYGLRQLAVLAAAVEHFIHDEAMGRLQASYKAHQVLHTELVTEDEANEIIQGYMLSFIFDRNLSQMSPKSLNHLKSVAPSAWSFWADTQLWLKDMQLSISYADRGVSNPFVRGDSNFPRVAHVLEEIGDRYPRFQDVECQDDKKNLMDRVRQLPGRVLLTDFYRKGLDGASFREDPEFLRAIGALDESDPNMPPSVIVPNYLNSITNCLGKSDYYLVCCIDECEDLMGQLEREIAMPAAEPQQIAALVASMPSDTMDASRNLSTGLLSRLDAIAERHAGRVPLHGRLFAQWMHHAYPNECQYPQPKGVTTWGDKVSLSQEAMRKYVNQSTVEVDELLVDNYDMPWMDVENLLEEHEQVPIQAAGWSFVRYSALLLASVSMIVSLARMSKSVVVSLDSAKPEKYSV